MVKRKLVKQPSGVYTITIPKSIVEANNFQDREFEIFLEGKNILLRWIDKEHLLQR